MDRQRARDLINDRCIIRVPSGSQELLAMNGATFYSWQFYLRRGLYTPLLLRTIGEDFWARYEQAFRAAPFQIAGVESACVSMLTAIVLAGADRGIELNAFTIRSERKKYGLRNAIEGVPNDLPVMFIDDLTSPQHTTFWNGVAVMSEYGMKLYPRGYVAVYKAKADEPTRIETSIGAVEFDSLFNLSDFSMSLADYCAEKAGA